MKLDSRQFSKEAYEGLIALRDGDLSTKRDCKLQPKHHKKASGLVQGLPAYIATWGLHRLVGDAKKFLGGTAEDTKYKGKVYLEFLYRLQESSQVEFQPDQEGSLIELNLREYTALNHLAMKLAKEWSFWSSSILGEPSFDESEEG
jgi:hypothetical protein